MAEEFVRIGQFEEFSRRSDEKLLALEKKLDQGFAHAEKAREQNFVHLNQRFDDMKAGVNQRFDDMGRSMNQRFDNLDKRMDQSHADMLQMRNWLVRLYGLVAFSFIGVVALILLKDVILK